MTPTLLQSTSTQVSSGTTLNATFGSTISAGSLLICYAGVASGSRTFTISDNVNGTYNNDITNAIVVISSFPGAILGGTPQVTVSITGAAVRISMLIEEWAGLLATSPLDKTATATSGVNGNTGTGGTTATLSTTNELAVAVMCLTTNGGTLPFAVANPWTASPSSPVTNATSTDYVAAGYNQVGASVAAQTATFNWTNSVSWRACTATYKPLPANATGNILYNRRTLLFYS